MTAATGSGCGNFPEGWVRQCLVNRPASPHHIQRDPSSQQQCPRLRIESNLSGMVLVVASLTFTLQPRCSGVDSLSEFPPSFVVGISFSSILLGCQPHCWTKVQRGPDKKEDFTTRCKSCSAIAS